MRPGFGEEHPQLAALLAGLTPAATAEVVWPGPIALRGAAYLTSSRPPDVIVSSVRGLIVARGRLVACRNADETHVWPGGQREPGESHRQTLAREVREETGWILDGTPPRYLGFLAYRYAAPQPPDHPYPHPAFAQLVFTAAASEHAGEPERWRDLDGREEETLLFDASQVRAMRLGELQSAYVARILAEGVLG